MKELTLFPASIMDIPCPYCKVKGRITFKDPPDKDFTVKCGKCKEQFKIKLNIREHYRKEIALLVSFAFGNINKMDEVGSYTGEITDLSKDGMAVESSILWLSGFKHKEDRVLTFVFSIPPKNEIVKVRGLIKRIEKLGETGKVSLGIRFVDLSDAVGRKINFFLWN